MNHILTVFRKYAVFSGRASRAEYWYFALFIFAINFVLGIVTETDANILSVIVQLAILVPSLTTSVRRMHDVNKNGWFILIPIYNLILALTEGTKGDNIYGPDPYAVTPKEIVTS
ncbi:hypothetical protein A3H10_01695 [Candidatus Uhrbacteria bacterium RIFCSPLOWO2_12_FULL_46_10]|uniref:DUF805 domain-containing protein n=1 Tax=Candidatus Uhrbacteria bacterium RIFCSPLOWO2_01_FULL_47_25 TaxID=1802402 RepID=A0A1F7UWX8_9BACT|nr:MAG: putative cytochrome [Parcubacteria group bacterium GW2011_GWA2_46_9]OGL60370.1 MAG: hypothetical protein A2752_01965 [Candidatus Uhrbacteria bacterium RIFCSPHIGHO2_01_FULL_46_23]OGL69771.1 MAG: hypothetical protein A3D60_01390 [Candidatus Uhrbacteria bacterium RIFCSPHIGHO2_02_FULL_47_29]OGL75371.1 MAG: hypothetical protein A3E96_04460 [Candidatus Uhrbacteria bacterium RIFCSPHIGHO2_12_FULL_46_13]OGL82756.1 MAG: hypothetical protein A2936_04400 [Candidatus Uhrbacteria bacterium RIFCSPLOWO